MKVLQKLQGKTRSCLFWWKKIHVEIRTEYFFSPVMCFPWTSWRLHYVTYTAFGNKKGLLLVYTWTVLLVAVEWTPTEVYYKAECCVLLVAPLTHFVLAASLDCIIVSSARLHLMFVWVHSWLFTQQYCLMSSFSEHVPVLKCHTAVETRTTESTG